MRFLPARGTVSRRKLKERAFVGLMYVSMVVVVVSLLPDPAVFDRGAAALLARASQ